MFGRRFTKRWKTTKKSPLSKKTGLRWSFLFFMLGGISILLVTQWKAFFLHHSSSQATQGGIFTESALGQINNLSPFSTDKSAIDKDIQALVFEGLLRYDASTGQISNGLGTLRISEDKKTYSITLRQNIFFHDGSPVTVEDVLFTYEQILQNENFPNKELRDNFEYVNITRVDEYTLSFTIPEQNVFFPFLLIQPIIPKKYFKNALIEEIVDPDHPFNKEPIGAGPYKLNNIIENEDGSTRVFLTHHKKYYQGTPFIEQMVFYLYSTLEHFEKNNNWTTSYSHLSRRELDHFIDQTQNTSESVLNRIEGYDQESYVLPRFTGIFFNLDRPVVSELPFRQALHKGLPKDRVLKKEKNWIRIDSPFFFDGIENWVDQSDAKARQILRDSGYPYNKEKKTRTIGEDGPPVELILLTSTTPAVYSRFAQNTKEAWEEALDINITLDVLPPQEFQEAVQTNEYDMVLFGINNADNYEGLSPWHSSQVDTINLSNLTNQKIDFMISEIRFSGSKRDLIALNHKLDQLTPSIILGTPEYNILLSKRLKGFDEGFGKIRSHAQRFSNIHTWYLEEELSWNWPQNRSKTWGFIKWIFGNKNPLQREDVKARMQP